MKHFFNLIEYLFSCAIEISSIIFVYFAGKKKRNGHEKKNICTYYIRDNIKRFLSKLDFYFGSLIKNYSDIGIRVSKSQGFGYVRTREMS